MVGKYIAKKIVKDKNNQTHQSREKMSFNTTIQKASTKVKSYRTTVPAAIMHQFNLKEGDVLEWTMKSNKSGEMILEVAPKKKD